MTELLTITGTITGTGVINLASGLVRGTVSMVRIPKGHKAKIWCKRIARESAIIDIEYTHDSTVASPVWATQSEEYLVSPGEILLEKRRPIVCRGLTGKEAIRVSRAAGTGVTSVDLEIEIGKD